MCGFLFSSDPKIDQITFKKALDTIKHRGPDSTKTKFTDQYMMGFQRLAIMDLTHEGDQPFSHGDWTVVCNGEIYNYPQIKETYSDFPYVSHSDCEVLIPLIIHEGIEKLVDSVDAEFAMLAVNSKTGEIIAARDPIGIRPLFYGFTKTKKIAFASEVKALQSFCTGILPFPPGHYFKDGKFVEYIDLAHVSKFSKEGLKEIGKNIREKLEAAVIKRLQSDAPIGFLLSGGLDSSLVCSIAAKYRKSIGGKPIRTFAIGMSEDAIDLKYAKQVADHIGSDHTEVIIERADAIEALRQVIYQLETWDITTIRASLGMYLVCKYIKEKTDVKVLLTGEVSDEIFGYKYTDFAPSALSFQEEAQKRLRELYIYDVLRADRCISACSLEARVPFSDRDFVSYVMSIDPAKKLNTYGHGKYLLRMAFEEGNYLTKELLYREKAAFSDAVGHSLVECIKAHAAKIYEGDKYEKGIAKYKYRTPFTTESLLFRDIFEEMYPGYAELILDYWMPNKEWENCNVTDPSARVLPNYGASGS